MWVDPVTQLNICGAVTPTVSTTMNPEPVGLEVTVTWVEVTVKVAEAWSLTGEPVTVTVYC